MSNPVSSFTNSFTAFAATQASVPLVPVAVEGSQVIYGDDPTVQRQTPQPLVSLRSVPIKGDSLFAADGKKGHDFLMSSFEETTLFKEWREIQETVNYLSDVIEDEVPGQKDKDQLIRVGRVWEHLRSVAVTDGWQSGDYRALINVAFGDLLVSSVGLMTYRAMGMEYLKSAAMKLINQGRFDPAAMIYEVIAGTRVPFQENMENFGGLVGHVWLRSLETSDEYPSYGLRLARGIWYGWFDTSGCTLEQFLSLSSERHFSMERYSACSADYVRMVGARLRKGDLNGADWMWISTRLGLAIDMWEMFGEPRAGAAGAAHDLAARARKLVGGA